MDILETSEMDEVTNGLTGPPDSLRRDTDFSNNASKSPSAPSSSHLGLGPDRISTHGEQVLSKGKIPKNLDARSNGNSAGSWFWADNEHIFLNSTPFTSNVPLFRHNPIRLVKAELVNSGTIDVDVLDWKLLSAPDETLDWTAFQIAILGGAGDFFSDPSDFCAPGDEEELVNDLCDWLEDLGYSSHSLGALVFEGAFVRTYKEQTDERPPSPLDDWTEVYRTLSHRQKQDGLHDSFVIQESGETSDVVSMMSYAESIFDISATMSTASSAPGDTQALISKFVDILVRDSSVARMISMALSDTGMGQERFRRNLGRIIRTYSRELRCSLEKTKEESFDSSYRHAAAFVSRKAPHASHLIVSRFSQARKSMPPRDGLPESDGVPSSESEQSEGENEIMDMEKLESFFVKGEPFRLLRWRLRALIYPDSFLSRVRSSTEQLVRVASSCGLTDLLSRAQQQAGQTSKNLWADFSDQIESLARDLRAQCGTLGQIRVADFLRVYSQYVAARLMEATATQQEPARQEHPTSDGILQDIVVNTLPDVWEIDVGANWSFISSTKAFQGFFNDLRDLAYPTIFSRARKLIAKLDEPEGRRLLPLLSEVEWAIGCRPAGTKGEPTFRISSQHHSLTDRLKLAVEAGTGAQWDWWPFCPPPRHQAYTPPGGEILSWICPCGMLRRERISPMYAKMLRDLAETLPGSLPADINITPVPSSYFGNNSPHGSPDAVTDDSSIDGRGSSSSLSSGSTPMTGFSSAGSSVAVSIGDNEITRFVFILVLDTRYHLVTTDVSDMTSIDFFQALAAGYNARRGILRRMLSIFVYSHCDFVQDSGLTVSENKVKRWAPNRFAPGNKFSFPPSNDDSYRYSPHPMLEPPISPHQFYELFYGCYDPDSLNHRLHNILSTVVPMAPTCDVLDNISDEFLLCLPKRDTSINPVARFTRGDKFEVFWGLVARERRSTARVIAYTLASLVPSLIFALEWMFGWGHLGDLQNASVPFTATCAMLGLLWAVVYSGSDALYG